MLKEAAVQCLKRGLRVHLIVPQDADYSGARQVHDEMIDRYPRLIVRCAPVDDVVTAVRVARELPLAIRGGGHNGARRGTRDDG